MNYILKHSGQGEPNAWVILEFFKVHDIKMLDNSAMPKMALVDGISDNLFQHVAESLPEGWQIFPQRESAYAVPDTRRKVLRQNKNN